MSLESWNNLRIGEAYTVLLDGDPYWIVREKDTEYRIYVKGPKGDIVNTLYTKDTVPDWVKRAWWRQDKGMFEDEKA
jgi:hypothetical protein